MKSRLILPFFISLSLFTLSQVATAQSVRKQTQVAIVSVNDVHAEMQRFPRFAYIVDSLRTIYPDLLLFSAGDLQSGNPINDQYKPKGYPIIALMNALGFNLSAVGNHEFDVGPERFAEITKEATFPFLSANIFPSKEWKGHIKPYTILTLSKGIRVAVFGGVEIGSGGIPSTHPARVKDFSFRPMREMVEQFRPLKDSANLVVMLTHLGVEEDKYIASLNPWIDLIVGGHSHTYINGKLEVNGVAITQSQNKLKHCALTLVTLDERGKPIDIKIHSFEIDQAQGQESAIYRLAVDLFGNNPIFQEKLSQAEDHFTNPTELGYLMCDAMREEAQADFAFHNHGGVRSSNLLKGPISVLDVYTMDPFGNELMKVELSVEEIKSFLRYCWIREGEKPMLCSGVKIAYTISKDRKLTSIELYTPDGKLLDNNRRYKVAYNSYIDASYPFDHVQPASSVGCTSADALIHYLRRQKSVPSYRGQLRYRVSMEME